jgi:GntR family transcriptional regulator
VRALAATEQLAGELRLEVGAPLLLLEGVSLDDRGAAVEVFSTWHRADRVVFDIDVTGDGGTAFPTPSVLPAEPTGRGRSKGRGSPLARRVRELSRELDAVSRELERGSH